LSDVVQTAHRALSHHGRTFALASRFLPASSRDDAAVLYALCRLIDDLADEAPDATRARSDLMALLDHLRAHASDGAEPTTDLDATLQLPGTADLVNAWLEVAQRRGVPLYPLEALVAGVLTDTGPVQVADDRELLTYCYRVAGTVGLLMCGVLDVHDPDSLPLAVELGIAMQLTNICRDVLEDADRGRVYLPADRLRAAGTSPEALLRGEADPTAVSRVVSDLLELADQRYARGEQGLIYLPHRCRFAIRAAARMYRAIGVRLRLRGSNPLEGRTVVPWHGKAVGLADAALRTLPVSFEEAA
jgi:phytoene synthase